MWLRIRIGEGFIHTEIGKAEALILDSEVGTVGGIHHAATKAAVYAKLVADVGRTFTPQIHVVKRSIGKDLTIAHTRHLDAESAVVGVMHLGLHLNPLILKVGERQIVDEHALGRLAAVA